MACSGGGKGRLEDCEIWGNEDSGVAVRYNGDPSLTRCIIRDHALRGGYPWHIESVGCGVFVASHARGMATVGAGCVFARNARGDVVGPHR